MPARMAAARTIDGLIRRLDLRRGVIIKEEDDCLSAGGSFCVVSSSASSRTSTSPGQRFVSLSFWIVGATSEPDGRGPSFLPDAKRVLALAAEIVESVRRVSRESAPLNVGYVTNLFSDLLPMTLGSFRRAFPAVSINLFDMSCAEQFRALEEGRIDLAFVGVHEPIEIRGLHFMAVALYKAMVALPKNEPLVKAIS